MDIILKNILKIENKVILITQIFIQRQFHHIFHCKTYFREFTSSIHSQNRNYLRRCSWASLKLPRKQSLLLLCREEPLLCLRQTILYGLSEHEGSHAPPLQILAGKKPNTFAFKSHWVAFSPRIFRPFYGLVFISESTRNICD